MNVVLVSGEYPTEGAGGIGTVARAMRGEFVSRDIPHKVICSGETGSSDDEIVSLNTRGKALVNVLDFGRLFRRYVERTGSDDDIYHFHLPAAVGPLLLCPEEILCDSVVTFHTTAAGFRRYLYDRVPYKQLGTRGKVYKAGYAAVHEHLERRAIARARNAAAVTTVSSGVEREVIDHYDTPVSDAVQNGVDAKRFTNEETDDTQISEPMEILAVGRLVPQKGFVDGLKTLARISEQYHLTVVGTGPMMDPLRELSERLNINANFAGYVSGGRLEELYRQADIQLMPSLYEGLPMVGLEAAGYETAIAATEMARVSDVICEENEELVVTGSEEMERTLTTLLSDPSMTARIGSENGERVRNQFTAERMVDRYLTVFEDAQQ